jgi:flagellin
MAMIVQHNIASINTNRQLGISTTNLSKNTEKLSSGYRINRAADDAAGLAISEKMRSQIRGLGRASDNASDGISMIQTAEGALNESHSILQRMRELAVQAANGTETDSDRSNLQDEIEQLQEELDRISTDTEFNTMPLLDGSLSAASGNVSSAGPKFGIYDTKLKGFVTASVENVGFLTNTSAVAGSESAIWDNAGKILTLNLADNTTYTQTQIDNLIKNAKQEDSSATNEPADITVHLTFGSYTATASNLTPGTTVTEKGVKAAVAATTITSSGYVGANEIAFTAKKYGADMNLSISIAFDAKEGQEEFEQTVAPVYDSDGKITTGSEGSWTLHLRSGKEYTEADLESIIAKAGVPLEVELSGDDPDEPNTLFVTTNFTVALNRMTGGAGLGDDDAYLGQPNYSVASGGGGVILQVGANEGQTMSFSIDDMSAQALGVNAGNVDLSTQSGASKSIGNIDEAIGKVSKQRALLGAVQNRLEHTIANLDNTAENMQAAESTIRDVDMAEEMVQYSKNNILQQAGQSMLAQANQSTQGVLSLLQG